MSTSALRSHDTSVLSETKRTPAPLERHVSPVISTSSSSVASQLESDSALEEELLAALNVDEDLAQLVPMPESIPAALRRALTEKFTHRFEFMEDLDAWLHQDHPELKGECPFERLIAGDGWSVLHLLRDI